jgi:CubicO group peptidase (beta-lactamase class C family)
MAQTGELDLDAPVFPMIRRWSPGKTAYDDGKVTARMLLSHTAGMSVGGFPGVDPSRCLPGLEESLSGDNEGRGKKLPSRAVRVVAEPGKSFSYSGGGYTVLQLLIEERSGEDFAAYMKRTVLEPCGMDSSSFTCEPSTEARAARAYSSSGSPMPTYRYTEKAAAGLYTTAGDLARLLDELYLCLHGAGGAVLDAEHAVLFASRIAPVAPGVSMGLGYFVSASKSGQTILSHSGSNRGWRSFYAMELESGHGIVLLTNSDAGYGLIRGVSDAMAGILD